MAKASKQVMVDVTRAGNVNEAARVLEDRIVDGIQNLAHAAGVKPPSVDATRSVLRFVGAMIEKRNVALGAADAALEAELGDDPAALRERDEAAAVVYGLLTDLRSSLAQTSGDDAVIDAGYRGATVDSREPVALAKQAHAVHDNLAKKPPRARRAHLRFDVAGAAEELIAPTAGLLRLAREPALEDRLRPTERSAPSTTNATATPSTTDQTPAKA